MEIKEKNRISQLDSLRGIAALIVVICHVDAIYSHPILYSPFGAFSPLHWIVEGMGSVIFFFVLSGFVLSLPYTRGEGLPYKKYVIRRFCRLYLPSLFSILFAGILWWFLVPSHPEVRFAWNTWEGQVDLKNFFSHAFMSGIVPADKLNGPLWSLIIETRAAFVFPFLFWGIKRYGWKAFIFLVFLGILSGMSAFEFGQITNVYYALTVPGTLLLTLYYLPFFGVGIYVAIHIRGVLSFCQALSPKAHFCIILLFFVFPPALMKTHFFLPHYWFSLISVYIIVSALIFQKFSAFLGNKAVLWLGKVSFSLYIVHAPLLFAFLYFFDGILPVPIALMIYFPVLFSFAHLVHFLVERPSRELGKRLTFVAG